MCCGPGFSGPETRGSLGDEYGSEYTAPIRITVRQHDWTEGALLEGMNTSVGVRETDAKAQEKSVSPWAGNS